MQPNNYLRAFQLFFPFILAACAPVFVMAQAYPPNGTAIPTVTLNGSAPIQEPPPNPPDQQSQWNMELVGFSDLQGRSAYQPIIINENGREIAYVGHHTGSAMNPLTGAVEPNGTSIVDVTDPAKPKYLAHIPGSTEAGEEAGGAPDGARLQRERLAARRARQMVPVAASRDRRRRRFTTSPIRPTLLV